MRSSFLALLVLGVLMLPGPVVAQQQRPKLQIKDIRVGFPGGVEDGYALGSFRAGAWAPVYVVIETGKEGLKGTEGQFNLTLETMDPDDVQTTYTITEGLPELGPHGQFIVSTYAKLASSSSEVSASLRYLVDGEPLGQPQKISQTGLDARQVLYLTLGSRLPGLRRALSPDPNGAARPGQESIAFVDKVQQLPKDWFGYEGLDLVVLPTGQRGFLEQLLVPGEKRRRDALVEWVQRGGHLLISVGRNQDVVKAIPELEALLPAKVDKLVQLPNLVLTWSTARDKDSIPDHDEPLPGGNMDVAVLEQKPGRELRTLMKKSDLLDKEGPMGLPLVVQGPAGLGRVTMVAFDLEQKPFTDWKGSDLFWKRAVAEAGPYLAGNTNDPNGYYDGSNELQGQMYAYLENFEEVPVISFGWVALFILLYIIVVGPLDYLFLKKVVKRLELTWITFPAVVLIVSAFAYVTAYWLKGNDLRIRKVDLVDIDLSAGNPQVVGRSWFTLFSPRIQHYIIGIEPTVPTWAGKADNTSLGSGVMVSWLGRPEDRRSMRPRGQSLFRRSYDYEPLATGLKGVPIQVWSTKSFAANWQAPIDAAKPLLIANLKHPPGNEEMISGEISWQPGATTGPGNVELTDTVLIYRKHVYSLDLTAGTKKQVGPLGKGGNTDDIETWLRVSGPGPATPSNPNFNAPAQQGTFDLDRTMKGLFFTGKLNNPLRNSGLRSLDHTWRLNDQEEAILIGRLAAQNGDAETIAQNPACPTRLWLGDLPSSGRPRPALPGKLRQETYVRAVIPIQPAPLKKE